MTPPLQSATQKVVYEGLSKKWIAWTYSDYGWHPNGFDTLTEAVAHESYGSEKVITRGVVDWEAVAKCPYPDCLKVRYKHCPVHGIDSLLTPQL